MTSIPFDQYDMWWKKDGTTDSITETNWLSGKFLKTNRDATYKIVDRGACGGSTDRKECSSNKRLVVTGGSAGEYYGKMANAWDNVYTGGNIKSNLVPDTPGDKYHYKIKDTSVIENLHSGCGNTKQVIVGYQTGFEGYTSRLIHALCAEAVVENDEGKILLYLERKTGPKTLYNGWQIADDFGWTSHNKGYIGCPYDDQIVTGNYYGAALTANAFDNLGCSSYEEKGPLMDMYNRMLEAKN